MPSLGRAAKEITMIRTVQQLREALHDAPDDMPVRLLVSGAILLQLDTVVWRDEQCVLIANQFSISEQEQPS